jgi:hypothetical protein
MSLCPSTVNVRMEFCVAELVKEDSVGLLRRWAVKAPFSAALMHHIDAPMEDLLVPILSQAGASKSQNPRPEKRSPLAASASVTTRRFDGKEECQPVRLDPPTKLPDQVV